MYKQEPLKRQDGAPVTLLVASTATSYGKNSDRFTIIWTKLGWGELCEYGKFCQALTNAHAVC